MENKSIVVIASPSGYVEWLENKLYLEENCE